MGIIRENRAQIIGLGLGLLIFAVIVSVTLYFDASKLDTVMALLGGSVLAIKLVMWLWNPKWP